MCIYDEGKQQQIDVILTDDTPRCYHTTELNLFAGRQRSTNTREHEKPAI